MPFNLRILADLVGAGVSVSQLIPLRTQLDLLERYWLERVIRTDGQADARETPLRSACEGMVRARQFRVPRPEVADASNSTAVNDLLSVQILVEWQPPLSIHQSVIRLRLRTTYSLIMPRLGSCCGALEKPRLAGSQTTRRWLSWCGQVSCGTFSICELVMKHMSSSGIWFFRSCKSIRFPKSAGLLAHPWQRSSLSPWRI